MKTKKLINYLQLAYSEALTYDDELAEAISLIIKDIEDDAKSDLNEEVKNESTIPPK